MNQHGQENLFRMPGRFRVEPLFSTLLLYALLKQTARSSTSEASLGVNTNTLRAITKRLRTRTAHAS